NGLRALGHAHTPYPIAVISTDFGSIGSYERRGSFSSWIHRSACDDRAPFSLTQKFIAPIEFLPSANSEAKQTGRSAKIHADWWIKILCVLQCGLNPPAKFLFSCAEGSRVEGLLRTERQQLICSPNEKIFPRC